MGRTMIIASHSPVLTSQLADYIVVLKDGAIVEQGELRTLTHSRNPDVIEVLSEVLSEAATYDTDLLNLLETDPE
jgi:phospholipid/cholesterol/gamma-HCH transport system ATP-binding protein